jgi:hypothetical protein
MKNLRVMRGLFYVLKIFFITIVIFVINTYIYIDGRAVSI